MTDGGLEDWRIFAGYDPGHLEVPIISNAQLTPVLPVVDVSRATGFYRDRLGLRDLGDEPGGNNPADRIRSDHRAHAC